MRRHKQPAPVSIQISGEPEPRRDVVEPGAGVGSLAFSTAPGGVGEPGAVERRCVIVQAAVMVYVGLSSIQLQPVVDLQIGAGLLQTAGPPAQGPLTRTVATAEVESPLILHLTRVPSGQEEAEETIDLTGYYSGGPAGWPAAGGGGGGGGAGAGTGCEDLGRGALGGGDEAAGVDGGESSPHPSQLLVFCERGDVARAELLLASLSKVLSARPEPVRSTIRVRAVSSLSKCTELPPRPCRRTCDPIYPHTP
jgi:hypothetical protein